MMIPEKSPVEERRGLRTLILVILVATLLGVLVEMFQRGGALREYFLGQ